MRSDSGAEVPDLTRDVARAAFPKGCLAMRIRDGLGPLFSDEDFKAAFGVRGRPGISPGRLALVSVLQFAENLTDRQAAHAVRARIDVKYLLGLELTDPGFDHTVLTGFRDRLLAHGMEARVLDLLLERLAELGLVGSGGRQRTDSTHVLAAVRGLNRLEFIGETLRAVLEALAAAAPDWLRTSMDPAWQERYGARVDAYRLPTDEQERRTLARQIATDGYRLLEAVFAPTAPGWLQQVPAVTVLRTVWVQQFTRTVTDGEEEVTWRGKDDLPPSRAMIASPYDPEARYAKKRGSAWVGYKIHLSESCDDPGASKRPHLITHVVTTDATVNDAMVVEEVHDRLTSKGLLPGEHLLDAGYTSAELLLTAPTTRGVCVVGPVRSNNTRQSTSGGGFGKSAFTINWQAKHALCPTGATSRYWTEGVDNNGRDAIRIRFATATCAPCPVRDQCTRSTQYGRQLTIRPQEQDAVLERVRAEQSTDEWKDRYAARAGVEGTIHQAVATAGVRRTRYIGLAKTRLAHILTATAINLIRLDAWWNEIPLARTRISRLAALDLAA
ncbi:IS1182 family transposase [Streptomyces sp. ALI-76-A]|uniref:IS1182 family transposase n=1 Tax=Streptomyces sp. ALI-76-A TaxID=3025736 RepID=UPI00256F2CDA|nr:IS1182 family transposase [Streptomyces sp. ALI-76-A]MDL5206487.1 IS1182 family transposase [Streptomyces sp. ALI-76-A]